MSADKNERKDALSDAYMELLKNAKTLQVQILLKQIGNKYGDISEKEKLRAEARDTFKIDSVYDYNFGIVGESGVGKSTLVNAFCGYGPNDNRRARVGITETTMEMERFPHPYLKHLVLYDLPGAGTPKNPQETYFCDKRLYVFDCLLLVMSERFRQIDLAIAKLAQEMGTPVVFVRNKAKNALKTMRTEIYPNLEEKELVKTTIETIKVDIIKQLKDAGIENPTIFVIEAHSLRKISKIKLEELTLVEYVTKLASARSGLKINDSKASEQIDVTKLASPRSGLKMNDSNACEEMDTNSPGASSKIKDVQATSTKLNIKDCGNSESKRNDGSGSGSSVKKYN